MGAPEDSLTLSAAQVAALQKKLSEVRHEINNHLTLISTGLELVRRSPDRLEKVLGNLSNKPAAIRDLMVDFTCAFEQILEVPSSPSESQGGSKT